MEATPRKIMATEAPPNAQSVKGAKGVVTAVPSDHCDVLPIFIAPPLGLDNKTEYCRSGCEAKQRSIGYRVLEMLKGVRPGADLTTFQLPPQLNLPKSQLQCFAEQVHCCGQNLLEQCADGATPLERFLAVVRWHISLTRPSVFAKAPYNPILGETHHVSSGDLNLLVEQVSHHPPISALYATNEVKKIQVFQWNQPVPKFYGTSVEVTLGGKRSMSLAQHGEFYEMTSPNLSFRFLPTPGSDWTGNTTVRCAQSDLEAVVSFKPRAYLWRSGGRNRICGKIMKSSTQEVLYTLSGGWDDLVIVEDMETRKKENFYDGKIALTRLQRSVAKCPEVVSPMESVVVWGKVTDGVWNQHWESAREAKINVEEIQRGLRDERLASGQTWKSKYFAQSPHGDWEWASKGRPVLPGPIIADNDLVPPKAP